MPPSAACSSLDWENVREKRRQPAQVPSKRVTSAPRKIRVCGLQNATVHMVSDAFAPFGEVARVDVPAGKNYCFVEFSEGTAATKAIELLDGHSLLGRKVQIQYARSTIGDHPVDPTQAKLWVSGMSAGITNAEIKQTFKDFGEVTRVDNPANKDYFFVWFANIEDGEHAKRALHNKKVAGRTVRITWSNNLASLGKQNSGVEEAASKTRSTPSPELDARHNRESRCSTPPVTPVISPGTEQYGGRPSSTMQPWASNRGSSSARWERHGAGAERYRQEQRFGGGGGGNGNGNGNGNGRGRQAPQSAPTNIGSTRYGGDPAWQSHSGPGSARAAAAGGRGLTLTNGAESPGSARFRTPSSARANFCGGGGGRPRFHSGGHQQPRGEGEQCPEQLQQPERPVLQLRKLEVGRSTLFAGKPLSPTNVDDVPAWAPALQTVRSVDYPSSPEEPVQDAVADAKREEKTATTGAAAAGGSGSKDPVMPLSFSQQTYSRRKPPRSNERIPVPQHAQQPQEHLPQEASGGRTATAEVVHKATAALEAAQVLHKRSIPGVGSSWWLPSVVATLAMAAAAGVSFSLYALEAAT